jgi:transposase InsO family protein
MFPKGDRPHVRYLLDKDTHLAYRRLMKTLNNSLAFESSDIAQFRLHVIEHSQRHGVTATLDAFNLKRSTFFSWKKTYTESDKELIALVPTSTRPKSVRKMETDWRLVAFVKEMRLTYGNVGKYIIQPFLDAYALELGIASISPTTISKVIRRRGFTFETRIKARRKSKYQKLRTRKSPRINRPGYVEVDTIHVTINQVRHYFISLIDVYTRFALVKKVPSVSSKQAITGLQAFLKQYPVPIHTVQTDNGGEFLKLFHQYLEKHHLKHVFIYPNSPQINGIVERFNRTIQEEFIYRCDEIYYDEDLFNRQLTKYLNWYNTKRPHSSLGYQSPWQFMQARVQ